MDVDGHVYLGRRVNSFLSFTLPNILTILLLSSILVVTSINFHKGARIEELRSAFSLDFETKPDYISPRHSAMLTQYGLQVAATNTSTPERGRMLEPRKLSDFNHSESLYSPRNWLMLINQPCHKGFPNATSLCPSGWTLQFIGCTGVDCSNSINFFKGRQCAPVGMFATGSATTQYCGATQWRWGNNPNFIGNDWQCSTGKCTTCKNSDLCGTTANGYSCVS